MIYLGNAFSLQMISLQMINSGVIIYTRVVDVNYVKEMLSHGFISCIGHQDTANILTNMLGTQVPMNRVSIKLTNNDVLIVAQVTGGRLQEGATTLPPGTEIIFIEVKVA